jgi:hypothetical protein
VGVRDAWVEVEVGTGSSVGLIVIETARVNVACGVDDEVLEGVPEKAGVRLGWVGSGCVGVWVTEGGTVGVKLGQPGRVDRGVGVGVTPVTGVIDPDGVSGVEEGSVARGVVGVRLGVTLKEAGGRLLVPVGVGLPV